MSVLCVCACVCAARTAVQGGEELFHVSTLPEGDRTNGQFFENKQPVKL